jgi:hypothetical protein
MPTAKELYDDRPGYCRKLGHHITFKYCRSVADGLPCHKVLDCWFEQFPVNDFINGHYSQEEKGRFLSPPQPKIISLLDLIKKAQEQNK